MFTGKTATASSVYSSDSLGTLSVSRAVDGISDYIGSSNPHRFCTARAPETDYDEWIMVDLEKSYLIWGVNIVYQYYGK